MKDNNLFDENENLKIDEKEEKKNLDEKLDEKKEDNSSDSDSKDKEREKEFQDEVKERKEELRNKLKEGMNKKSEKNEKNDKEDEESKLIFSKIQPIAFKYGLEISENTIPEGCSYPAMLILKAGSKQIIVNESYNLTTGQGQTTYQGKLAEMYKVVRDNPDTLLINILDGAGWIARGSDCKQIYNNCHQFLNLKTIDYIEQIITDFYNIY